MQTVYSGNLVYNVVQLFMHDLEYYCFEQVHIHLPNRTVYYYDHCYQDPMSLCEKLYVLSLDLHNVMYNICISICF